MVVALIERSGAWGAARNGDRVTDDRARKKAVRRRMAQTGEKYTEARRAVGGTAGDPQTEPEPAETR